jgi:hypothetical protein
MSRQVRNSEHVHTELEEFLARRHLLLEINNNEIYVQHPDGTHRVINNNLIRPRTVEQ